MTLTYQSGDGALRFVLHPVPYTDDCVCPRLPCGGLSTLMVHCPEHRVPELLSEPDGFCLERFTFHQHAEVAGQKSYVERVTEEAIRWWREMIGPVTLDQILGKGRSSKTVEEARHCIIWAVWKTTGLSFPVLGTYFDRDHTTIINSTRRAEGLSVKYPLDLLMETLGVIR